MLVLIGQRNRERELNGKEESMNTSKGSKEQGLLRSWQVV